MVAQRYEFLLLQMINCNKRFWPKIFIIIYKHLLAFLGIGFFKDKEVSLHIDQMVPSVASPHLPVPLAYQEKLSAHLPRET